MRVWRGSSSCISSPAWASPRSANCSAWPSVPSRATGGPRARCCRCSSTRAARVGEPLSTRVAELLREALDQPTTRRADWLAHACAGDARLHATLARLLDLDARDDLALD